MYKLISLYVENNLGVMRFIEYWFKNSILQEEKRLYAGLTGGADWDDGQIERRNRGNSFSLETLYQIADALEIEAELLMKDEM